MAPKISIAEETIANILPKIFFKILDTIKSCHYYTAKNLQMNK